MICSHHSQSNSHVLVLCDCIHHVCSHLVLLGAEEVEEEEEEEVVVVVVVVVVCACVCVVVVGGG